MTTATSETPAARLCRELAAWLNERNVWLVYDGESVGTDVEFITSGKGKFSLADLGRAMDLEGGDPDA